VKNGRGRKGDQSNDTIMIHKGREEEGGRGEAGGKKKSDF
jgi:hypothetical protein